jgi:preprotein translocase subunit SecY
MVSAFLNSVKIPELRRRILFTLAVIVIVRLGAAISTPGVNPAVLQEWFRSTMSQSSGGGVAALFNLFSGGALENCAIFSLGIMPYISASIMLQLLTAVSEARTFGARRWRAPENHADDALRDGRIMHRAGLLAGRFIPAS